MAKGLFNRIYVGDPKREDLTKEALAGRSRLQVFWEVIVSQIWKLIGINLLYVAFLLPAIIWTLWTSQAMNITAQVEGGMTGDLLMGHINYYLMWLIPCLVFAGPATGGLFYVIRLWARDEHAWAWSDFWQGFKENWRQGLVMMLINGLAMFLLFLAFNFYLTFSLANPIYNVAVVLVAIMALFFGMMNLFIFPLMVSYKSSLLRIIKNAFWLVMSRLPWALLFLAVALTPAVLCLAVSMWCFIFYILIGFSLTALVVCSFANSTFDRL